ncbi:nucleoside-diphosphate-sugar epimerase [Nakamurella sp. UYEF19]|uniref:NAD-dependent epimerase/dehydratase family protein n=1 Tax=Nakamurella sp. UYEF19 TaxID=1756392 RepID=UPI0033995196
MKVLLTGATGMMGRSTAVALLARGDTVTVLQRRPAGVDCREVLGDIADPRTVAQAVRGQDAVLHLSAKVDVFGPWAEFARVNIDGTRAVIDGCRRFGVGRLVHVSSPSVSHAGAALVGAGAGPADPDTARSNYSRSKAAAELLALEADSEDLAVLCIRPHLVWGPGDTQLVQPIIERAAAGRLPMIGTGAALIDTTYVDNAVDALVAALDRCGPVHGESLVVSNGEPRSVGEILRRVCLAAGVPGPRGHVSLPVASLAGRVVEDLWSLIHRNDRPPMTSFLAEQLGTAHWFDQRHTRAVLEWSPRIALEEGFELLRRSLAPETMEGSAPPPRS